LFICWELFVMKFTSKFSPFSSRSVFYVDIIQKYTLLKNIADYVVPHCWLTVNWEQMAHDVDNCCLLLTNQKQTPVHEPYFQPCNIMLCRSLQVNYFPSFQALSAVKHAESSAKFACASRPAIHRWRWNAEPWTIDSFKNVPVLVHWDIIPDNYLSRFSICKHKNGRTNFNFINFM
jgi:hypothetical protein